ncbi:Calx-beta domain-containing protein [Geminocystis herdmanii]|uniref:Calx-beta domain-containing protein n=1 Tax=Geminocystis herdmanii TaxID=669359 RepID=UPI00034B4764|nr:Calx-beta domain-containing protein [Geminocystis herdmanii]
MAIDLASRLSAITVDSSTGVTHIVWADNGNIFHAVYDNNSETWKDAQAIAFTGTEPVTSLNLVANDKLIDGSNPGLAVVWQQGSLNDSDFFYTAANYDSNADLQWLETPQALTSDQVADLEPTVTVNSSGEVIVVGSKVNLENATNLGITEDTDHYYQQFSVSSTQFSTSTSTITPTASYSPQLTNDGLVNLGVLNNTNQTTQAVQSTTESDGFGVSSETEQPGQQPVGSWNAQLSFASSLLEDWELMHSVPKSGFLRSIITPFLKNWELVGTLSGGTTFPFGGEEASIFLKTNAQLEWKSPKLLESPWKTNTVNNTNSIIASPSGLVAPGSTYKQNARSPITFGFDLDSTYKFSNTSPYDLLSIDDILGLTASVKFPIVPAVVTEGFFTLDATGSVGINFNLLATPETTGGNYSPQTLGAALGIIGATAFGEGASLLLSMGDKEAEAGVIAADIAINVAETFAAFINGTAEGLVMKGSIGFPVLSTGLVGKAQIPHVPILSADINGGVTTAFNWGIGSTDNTISFGFPIGFDVKVGPIGLGFNFNPGWTWDVFDGNKNSTESAVSAETASSFSTTTAQTQVSGSLLTIDLETTISALPNPNDFTVTVTDINGAITTIPVFNVLQGNSPTTIVLQLESSIASSENLDYTTSDNPTPTSNAISLSFINNEGITNSEGNVIENISGLNVTNVTPNTLNYTFNPTSGNSQNYINPTLLLSFNTPLNTNSTPDFNRFTVIPVGQTTALSVINAQVTNNGVLLTFASSVSNQSLQNVTIAYSNSTNFGNALEDSSNNPLGAFTINNGVTTQVSQSSIFLSNNNSALNLTATASDYTVNVTDADGNPISETFKAQSATITNGGVLLTINQNISPEQNVSISYNNQIQTSSLVTGITPPSVNTNSVLASIEADLGQDSTPTLSFTKTGQILAAWVAEVPPLEPIAGFVNGNEITLNFVDSLGNGTDDPTPSQFTITDSNNNSYTVGNVSTVGNSLTLTLDTAVTADVELKISYQIAPSNNQNLYITNTTTDTTLWIDNFNDFALDNITGSTNSPILLGSGSIVETSSSNKVTLVFDQNLTGSPLNTQFTVQSNGVNYVIEPNITINNNTVVLTVQPPTGSNLIGTGDIVTVSYSGSSLSGTGGTVATFSNEPVITSPTTPTTVIKYGFGPSGDNLLSSVASIPGSGGLNFYPVAALDQLQNNVLVWSYADSNDINTDLTPGEIYSDDQTQIINESLNQSDIYYSIYNATTGTWSIANAIAVQQGTDGKIALGTGPNGNLMAAWLNYDNGESTIYWSSLSYNNDVPSWSSPAILYSDANPDPLTELSITTLNGNPSVFWTETQQTSYSELTFNESPLLYYRLAETSGTTLTNEGIYGAGGNGTYSGSVTFNEVGALEDTTTNEGDANPAVLFNSGNSATSSTIPLSGISFSVEFWFKVPSLPSNTLDLVSASGLMNVTLNNSGLSLNINNTALNSSGFNPSANEWYYVVATYNGETDTVNLSVNGENVGSLDSVDLSIPSNTSLTLAGSSNESVYLDEVAFYRQALTDNDTPDISDFGNLTASQISQILLNTSQIGNKYNAQYVDPLPAGPNTQYVTYDGSSWGVPSIIEPNDKPVATQLSDANKVQWDVTSYNTANSSGYVNPNGNPDIFLSLNLGNQTTGTKISSIEVTANNVIWSVGNTNGNQLAVVQGDKLLNPVNPDGSFDYTILSPNVDLDLFLDAGSNNFPSGTTFNVTINYSNGSTTTQTVQAGNVTSEPTDINSNQVLGIATVTEANDSSLALIDSGFIINTTNSSMGYVITNGDFNNDGKSDVAVGNRGYTNTSGSVLGQGTIQILFGGGAVLSNNESNPLTTTDLSGNPNGVLITGLSDTGQANGDFPFSMATGDVNGDGYEDLVIGDPNANKVYVIYGSNNLAGTTINVTNLGSQGYVINTPTSNIGFGYSVAVGNFNSNAESNGTYASGTKFDIAIGAPVANNGNGAVYVAFDGTSTLSTIYSSQNDGELAGYSVAVSSRTSQAKTFTGNTTSDDLIIGAIGFSGDVTNQWNGLSGLPSSANSTDNPAGQSYPSTSTAELGAVYVFQSNGTTSNTFNTTPYATYTGSNLPSSNGTANNSNAGSALNSTDLDGDKINDLAISAPGGANNNGLIYVLKGGITQNNNPQNLDTVANLGIVGGLPFSQTGAVITSPGDVNNDGYEDFLITAPQGANGTGQSYVLFGPLNLSDIGTIFDLNVTASDSKTTFLLNGDQPYQLVGAAASGIGDVNGDSVDDLMISAPNAGQLYTIFGHPWLADDGSIKLADISADNGFVIDGMLYLSPNSPNGYILGLSDSSTNETYGINIPVGVLFLLNPRGTVVWQSDNTTPAVQALMQTDGNFVLYSQAQALNEPGSAEYAVWATGTNTTQGAYLSLGEDGGLYIVSNSGSILSTLNQGTASATSNNTRLLEENQITSSSTTFINNSVNGGSLVGNGNNVVMLGDINGDGFGDVLSGGSEYGAVIVFGNSTTNLIDAAVGTDDIVITVSNQTINQFLPLGDINGDGLKDFGVIDNNDNFYVQLGSSSIPTLGSNINLSTVAKTSIIQGIAIGDYNGDGYGDVVLRSTNGVWTLYEGSANGTLTSDTDITFSGLTGNGLGDINGDGYTEVGLGNQFMNLISPNVIANGQFTVYLGNNQGNSTIEPPNAVFEQTLINSDWTSQYNLGVQSAELAPTLVEFNGYLYMLYNATDNVDSNKNTLWIQRSADGVNWEGLTNLGSSFETDYQASLGVFNNTLYLAFTATNNEVILASAVSADTDLGLTFSGGDFYQIGSNTSEQGPTLVTYNDELYAFFLATNGDNSVVYVTSDNPSNSDTWTTSSRVPYDGGTNSSSDRIGATVFNDELYIAFKADNSNNISVTSYNGSTWSSANSSATSQVIPNQGTSAGPSLIATDETLYLFFKSGNSSETIFYISGEGLGENWTNDNASIPNQSSFDRTSPAFFNQSIYIAHVGYNNDTSIYVTASNPIFEPNQTQELGSQLQGIGDFNGDGIEDYGVLAPGYATFGEFNGSNFENNQGALFIYYGSTSSTINSTPDVVLNPDYSTNTYGISQLSNFTAIGDINGDGYDDVAIASPSTSLTSDDTQDGTVFVVFGGKNWGNTYSATNPFDLNSLSNNQSNSNTNNSNTSGFLITGLPASQAGISLSGDGDVNGDGFSDFIIGAPGDNDNLSYVIFGSDFNNTVTQTGTIGDDVMIGTATGESFIGGEGDDQIYTNGGIDVVYAGLGDDFVTVNDTYFRRLDGGAGIDVLRFEGYNKQDWDLTTLSPGNRLRNFEILVTEGYGANNLTLNSLTVTQLSPTNTVTVVMDASDTLNLSADFSLNGTVYQYNQKFDRYTSNISSATVLLNRIVETDTTNVITVEKNASSTNTPTSNLTSEVASVNAEIMTSFNTDESGNETAQSVASSVFSATASNPDAPTRLSVSNPTANEADGEVEFTIQRTGDLDKYVQVHYLTQDGRGKAGSDYNPVLGRAVFKPGETSKTISVPLILDDIYTGTRDLGLLVTLEEESNTVIDDEFHLNVDPTDGQIRNWNHIIGEQPNSVMGGELEFRATTTDGKAQVKLYFEGTKDFNNYYIFNNETQQYEAFSGAKLFDDDGDGKNEGAILNLQDGSKYDIDGAENGIIFKRGFFAFGESPEIVLDTAMYRFRSLQTEGAYLYVGAQEKESVLTNYGNNFVEEGLAFYVSDTQEDDLTAFNRFRNTDLMGGYIYAGDTESESIRANYPQFIDEGIAFYAYGANSQMADSITRFQNSTGGAYLYTGQPETQSVITNYANSFNLEGIAFEALLA